jgi:hypothetical protein
MAEDAPSYRSEFLKSPHHGWLGLLTLGAGFVIAQPLALVAGATAYLLGWIYLPDASIFRRWVDRRREKAAREAAAAEVAAFVQRRDALLGGLTAARKARYSSLANVCKDIERAATETPDDPRLRKLEELMWTYLRLLTIEESLEQFLEIEARDDVPGLVAEARRETDALKAEVEASKARGAGAELDARERLLNSRLERLATLGKRADRVGTARDNLALVVAEQERLDQQIKLIRADSVATRNAAALSARIDATVENLEHTNKWLSEMDQFRDIVTDLPLTTGRAGFGEAIGSLPVPPAATPRRKESN